MTLSRHTHEPLGRKSIVNVDDTQHAECGTCWAKISRFYIFDDSDRLPFWTEWAI
jgi:hypothetical protein